MSTATRLNLTPRETPQSISVVTRQQMDDRNIQSAEDLTNIVPGLTLNKGATERASFYSRGFSISYFTQDGLPLSSNADTLGFSTLAIYDRVEILRGSAGMITGAGNPSGVLNFVRKRPTREPQVLLQGSVGRWDNLRAQVDVGGPLNASGTVRGRAVLAGQNSDTYISNYRQRRGLAYATIDADLTPDTLLSVGFHHNVEKNPGSNWYGMPTLYTGQFMPVQRSMANTPDWTYWNKSNSRVFAELEHRFGNGWKAKLAAQHLTDKLDSLLSDVGRVGRSEVFNIYNAPAFIYDRTQGAIDLNVSGPFQLLGHQHEVVFGAMRRTLDTYDLGIRQDNYNYRYTPVFWNSALPPTPVVSRLYYGTASETKQNAVYALGRFKLADPLSLLVGARMDWYDYDSNNPLTGARTTHYKVDREVTPYVGLVYDLNDTYSVYGSWTSVFNPQSAVDENGELLKPVTGTNTEVGVKAAYFGGALNLSAAAFRVVQQNLAASLPPNRCRASLSCSEAAGEVVSRGFELEAAGELMPGWQVAAGYTYNKAKYSKDADASRVGTRFAPQRPKQLVRLSTTYQLPGALANWRIGGGMRSQSEVYVANTNIRQGGYTVYDLSVGWKATPRLDVQLNINNLFDKRYYQAIGGIDSGNAFGEPRNIQLTAKYRFL